MKVGMIIADVGRSHLASRGGGDKKSALFDRCERHLLWWMQCVGIDSLHLGREGGE